MNLSDLDTPALIVDLDRLERNIARMAAVARDNGKALRPHTKTHKCPEIARLQLAAGAVGLTCAKLGEAEVYADEGFKDVFIANDIVGAQKVERLIALAKRIRIAVGFDSIEQLGPIDTAARAAGIRVPVRMEIDTGHHRAGVRIAEAAVQLGRQAAELGGVDFEGIFTHEGHLYKVPHEQREMAAAGAAILMGEIAHLLGEAGVPCPVVSVGSTPSVRYIAQSSIPRELRPGVYVFNDLMQSGMESRLEDCALTVLATVVSRPEPGVALIDAGTKSMSGDKSAGRDAHGHVTDDAAIHFNWASEEHGHLDLSESTLKPKIGDRLRIIPWHACACVNMHEQLHAVRGEQVEAIWPIAARGKIN